MTETVDLKRRSFLLGRLDPASKAVGPLVAVIGPSCFALQGVACMSCRDTCETGAVRFDLAIGGARPRIMADACSGCGDCTRACPADAIHLAVPESAA